MPVQKIRVVTTILCDAESLELATNVYSNMSLEQVAAAIDSGDDIGSVHVEGVETVPADRVVSELQELGNDGEFFAYMTDEED